MIEFKGKGVWKFSLKNSSGSEQGIEFRGNSPKLIYNNEDFEEKFKKCFQKIFKCKKNQANAVWRLVDRAKSQKHGTMLVFSKNAKKEAQRLNCASFTVESSSGMGRYMKHITAIDGAVLLDQEGKIYAIGVILDGETPDCGIDMSRGARYNSAIKYSASKNAGQNLVVVLSEDGYANLISGGREL